jgi:hypothetical protein
MIKESRAVRNKSIIMIVKVANNTDITSPATSSTMVCPTNLVALLLAAASVRAAPSPVTASQVSSASTSSPEVRDALIGTMYAYEALACAQSNAQDRFAIYQNHVYKLGSRKSYSVEWQPGTSKCYRKYRERVNGIIRLIGS